MAATILSAPRSFIGPNLDRPHRFRDGALAARPAGRAAASSTSPATATNNAGRSITEARDQAVAAGVTINGLAIINDKPNLGYSAHTQPPGGLPLYRRDVIGGPNAFLGGPGFQYLRRCDGEQAREGDRRGPRGRREPVFLAPLRAGAL